MDIASVVGLVGGIISLVIAIWLELEGILGKGFLNIPGIVLIFGGTLTATLTSFTLKQALSSIQMLKITLFNKPENHAEIIEQIVAFSQKARREGLLSLEADIENIKDPFFRKGMQLVVDGVDPDLVKEILETELAQMEERHRVGAEIFNAAGGYAPTMGMIGAIVGLVGALGKMAYGDMTKTIQALGIAFLASFYGIAVANLVFLPIAGKLKILSAEEVFTRELIICGVLSIQAGDNPKIVEERLKSFFSSKNYPLKGKELTK